MELVIYIYIYICVCVCVCVEPSPLFSFIFHPNIRLRILFSNSLSLDSSLNVNCFEYVLRNVAQVWSTFGGEILVWEAYNGWGTRLAARTGFVSGSPDLRAGALPTTPSRRITGSSQNFSLIWSPLPSGPALLPSIRNGEHLCWHYFN